MPNLSQPKGVSLTLDVSQSPPSGFIELQSVEQKGTLKQITLPNLFYLNGTASLPLVINDALLRTHQDEIVFNSQAAATLYVLQTPIKSADELETEGNAIKFDLPKGHSRLRLQNGVYELVAMTATNKNAQA